MADGKMALTVLNVREAEEKDVREAEERIKNLPEFLSKGLRNLTGKPILLKSDRFVRTEDAV